MSSTLEHPNGHFLDRTKAAGSSHSQGTASEGDFPSVVEGSSLKSLPRLTIGSSGSSGPQQSWITNTASTLESNGVVMQRFPGGGNSERSSPQLTRKPMHPDERVNCAYCGTTGEVDKYYAKSTMKEFCSINCLKAATKKMYEIPSAVPKKKESSPDRKFSTSLQSSNSGPVSVYKRNLGFRKLSPSLTVEVNRTNSTSSYSETSEKFKGINNKIDQSKISPSVANTYDWTLDLESDPDFSAAPVSSFKHVPVRGIWENVQPGMKLEVQNQDTMHSGVAFWVASVIRIHGYKVLLRFEGYAQDTSRDFWANLCLPEVHPVGWCASQNQPLIPPIALNTTTKDWREFLVKRLTGARTIPQNFHDKVNNALKSKYEIGTELEVVDKTRICRVRQATIVSAMGKRLRLLYYHENNEQDDFWCHENSSLIHPLGWANAVGQNIYAPKNYNPPNLHSKMKSKFSHLNIQAGMKLEAVDPLNLSAICAATIKKVLRYDYIMVRVDCYEEDTDGSDWFCYELSSPSIFPCGFCSSNQILLTPPNGYKKEIFDWNVYFKETKTKPAPLDLIPQKPVTHAFKVGMRLEAADLMDPRLICVATIGRVVGNLLKIHFNGWEEEYDQWLDAGSPDIYPIGWCELVRHRLEAPPQPQVLKKQPKIKKKNKKTTVPKRAVTTAPSFNHSNKKRKLMPEKLKPISMKPRVPPVIIQKKNIGSNIKNSNSRQININSVSLHSSEPALNNIRTTAVLSTPLLDNGESSNNELSIQIASTETPSEKIIPKLIDSPSPNLTDVDPLGWDTSDVSEFLRINDCGAYCDSFQRNRIDGSKLLNLKKDEIIVLTGIKVGPAVKILDMISQLKRSANVARVRKNIFP